MCILYTNSPRWPSCWRLINQGLSPIIRRQLCDDLFLWQGEKRYYHPLTEM